jgi:hypothetical protein
MARVQTCDEAQRPSQQLLQRINCTAIPELKRGFLASRQRRPAHSPGPSDFAGAFDVTLALLYRLLFAFYAESRELPPVRKTAYFATGLTNLSKEIAQKAGSIDTAVRKRLEHAYSSTDTSLHCRLFGEETFGSRNERQRIPDLYLALTIDSLARVTDPQTETLVFVDYRALPVRLLGSIYEHLLESNDKRRRKASGAYYTPDSIVRYIVRRTIGPVLDKKLKAMRRQFQTATVGQTRSSDKRLIDRLLEFRVVDPAMGTGHFLIEALHFVTQRMLRSLNQFSHKRYDERRLKRQVLKRCIYGVDLDPVAVELAKTILWLDAVGPVEPLDSSNDHLCCGNALIGTPSFHWERGFPEVFENQDEHGSTGFDCVVGNPPYGADLAPDARRAVTRLLPLMQHNGDTAVGFIERAETLVRDGGRVGLVVPKPLTYSFSWRHMRRFLRGRVLHLVDVSRAWEQVLLEQIILVFAKPKTAREYWGAAILNGKASAATRQPWAIADRYDTLPCALGDEELGLLGRLALSTDHVGDICRTFRGIGCQRLLNRTGAIPVIGGRDLERWRVRSCSGFLDTSGDLTVYARPKLVFQNIIAHIARPVPHIKLIGAYDRTGTVTLDTVNNIIARHDNVDLLAVVALLHSELVNWFVHAVIYNKAIRTMHFDQYFLNKIPLPKEFERVQARLANLARECIDLQNDGDREKAAREAFTRRYLSAQQKLEAEIDRLVSEAYGLPSNTYASTSRALSNSGSFPARATAY